MGMTLDEAILHCQEVAASGCSDCCKEHEQLAMWLTELKARRRKGYWNFHHMEMECSECGWDYNCEMLYMSRSWHEDIISGFLYCPHCGVRMEGVNGG